VQTATPLVPVPAPTPAKASPRGFERESRAAQPLRTTAAKVAASWRPRPVSALGYLLICDPGRCTSPDHRGEAAPTLRLTLPVGLLSECRATGYESYLESMSVTEDEMSQRNITLRKQMGIISLATTEGAQFYVDEELMGTTPIMHPISVAAGTHTLTLKKDGFFTWSSNVTVDANATDALRQSRQAG
jgi:hypothetical protein